MTYRCTYSGFPDEPHGGPTCAEPTPHGVPCPWCGEVVARCERHGGLKWATKVATVLHAEKCEERQ